IRVGFFSLRSTHPPVGPFREGKKKPTPKMKERRSILLPPQCLPAGGFTRKVRLNPLDDVTTQATYDQPFYRPNKVDCLRRSPQCSAAVAPSFDHGGAGGNP